MFERASGWGGARRYGLSADSARAPPCAWLQMILQPKKGMEQKCLRQVFDDWDLTRGRNTVISTCARCGALIGDDARACGKCSEAIATRLASGARLPRKRLSIPFLILAVGFSAALVVGGGKTGGHGPGAADAAVPISIRSVPSAMLPMVSSPTFLQLVA